jgi:hypothetical protein
MSGISAVATQEKKSALFLVKEGLAAMSCEDLEGAVRQILVTSESEEEIRNRVMTELGYFEEEPNILIGYPVTETVRRLCGNNCKGFHGNRMKGTSCVAMVILVHRGQQVIV